MKHRFLFAIMMFASLGFLAGCQMSETTSPIVTTETSTSSQLEMQLNLIYSLGFTSGDIDTSYEEWLDSIKGADGIPGTDGKEVTFRIDDNAIQWQYVGDSSWTDLVSFSDMTGFDSADELTTELDMIRAQLDEMKDAIETLTSALSAANEQIDAMNGLIDEVESTVEEVDLVSNISLTIEAVIDSVVGIKMQDEDGEYSSGSGVLYKNIDSTYYVVTNYHVVEGEGNPYVYLDDKSEVLASVVGFDYYSDLAVITFDSARELVLASIDANDTLSVGEFVLAIGSPLGISNYNTVTMGIASGLDRDVAYADYDDFFGELYIQHDAPISPGNSGGGLFNLHGELVGINTLKMVDESIEGIAYAIPAYLLTHVLTVIEQGDYYMRPELGFDNLINVNAIRNNPQDYPAYFIPSSVINGLYVHNPWTDYVLGLAGILDGDIILSVNDHPIHSWQELYSAVYYRNGLDDVLAFEVCRNSDTIFLQYDPNTYVKGYYTYEIKETFSYYYIGELYYGLRDGFGTCIWDNGDLYVGDWSVDQKDGYEILLYANGDLYIGDFVANHLEGEGELYWENGDSYVGGFLDDHRYGDGTYTWVDGDYFVAFWIDNTNTTLGIYYDSDGTWDTFNLVNGSWVHW